MHTLSQNDRNKFKQLYLLHGSSACCKIWHPLTRKAWKCVCQISSELAARRARFSDLNERVKNRSFQAPTVARISSCSLYAGDIGLMHSREPVRRVTSNVCDVTSE